MDPTCQHLEPNPLPQSVAGLLLRLHVTMGRITAPLKDLIDLSPGATVELGKPLNDPVEAVVNGKVLLRGQLMVVGGQYALKVLEKI